MCLDTRFKPEVEKKMIAKLPDGLITVFRQVKRLHGRYRSVRFGSRSFRNGINRACTKTKLHAANRKGCYNAGYHSLKTNAYMKKYPELNTLESPYIKFQIRKEWITAIGKQSGYTIYVTDRIISPSLRDKSVVAE